MEQFQSFLRQPWRPNWFSHPPPSNTLVEMVIVEPRPHENLPYSLSNMSHMFPYASLTVIHSQENKDLLESFIPSGTNIRLLPILPSNLDISQYSKFMTSPSLWEILISPYTLVFQTDSGVRKNDILSYLHYDYIGAPWGTNWGEPNRIPCYVGNGGFSLRKREAMLEMSKMPEARTFTGPEDIYFVRQLSKTPSYKIAPPEVACQFSVETIYYPDPMAFHKPWDSGMPLKDILTLPPHYSSSSSPSTTSIRSISLFTANGNKIGLRESTRSLLMQWFSLGISADGFHISPNAVFPVPYVDKDIRVLLEFEDHPALTIPFVYSNGKLCPHSEKPATSPVPPAPLQPQTQPPTNTTTDVEKVLDDIQELGFLHIQNGKLLRSIPPRENIYTKYRWEITLRYLQDYSASHPDFSGEFYLCIYDGWREYSEYVPHGARKYVPWTSSMTSSFIGRGSENEPRFRHLHEDISIYPVLPRPVLAYCRHKGDTNTLLIPDAEFLQTEFKPFIEQVNMEDIPYEQKQRKIIWKGSRHISQGYSYQNHVDSSLHPREQATKYASVSSSIHPMSSSSSASSATTSYLDASYEKKSIGWQLQHRYLLDLDGMVSAWSGLYWKLWSNSVVIKLQSHWEQWYYHELIPYTHYIPLESFYQLPYIYKWLSNNQLKCEQIAKESSQFIKKRTYQYACKVYRIHQ